MIKNKLDSWKLAVMDQDEVCEKDFCPKTSGEILMSGCKVMDATVPGNLELDLIKEGMLPEDIYFGENILETYKFESTHLWYFTEFEYEDNGKDGFLLFEGIDTAADIYIDGEHFAFTENMLISHEFSLKDISYGKHGLVVHITPASVYVRDIPYDTINFAFQKYNADSVLIRKPPYMFGWDIMPRTVSAGLWKDVSVVYKNKNRLIEPSYYILEYNPDRHAVVQFKFGIHTSVGDMRRFTVKIEGKCGDSEFSYLSEPLFTVNVSRNVVVPNAKLWWPKNYGEPNLYEVKITLLLDGEECDSVEYNMGLRKVELVRTSCAGKDGKFEFLVNEKRIFVLGTNWVPTDAFPSRHKDFNLRGLKLTDDIGCNMIRCWGGNAYPDDDFYDYCDKNGIMVWQDFTMACGYYPQDERFCNLIRTEAEQVVKALRNHVCLALWSGDNECDSCGFRPTFNGKPYAVANPNDNIITRQIIPEVIRRLDRTRPYLPSSPYYDEEAFATDNPSEQHLWGPRDYFKGDFYYKKSVCHFASETGYHGCPSPETLRKFISEENINDRGNGKVCNNRQWLTHATAMTPVPSDHYSYRIPLMTRQVERLFGEADGKIATYALQSQISQAEAMKFFIEHFRVEKWYRTGIIWWNIIDGWPQISDAVVDWYGTKKLAYHYIKCSQNPFCIICDEPNENGKIKLCASNDTREAVNIEYTVTDALTGEKIVSGTACVQSDTTTVIDGFMEADRYYLIKWSGDAEGENHFKGRIGNGVSLEEYTQFMKAAGYYDKLEGFTL